MSTNVFLSHELISNAWFILDRTIKRSSYHWYPYSRTMYNRNGQSEDPRVCVQGWADECVYLEGSTSTVQEQLNKGGANVFIRNSKTKGWYSFQYLFS